VKNLVIFYSETGNTAAVAEAIAGKLPGQTQLKPLAMVDSIMGFDCIFIGFPIHQFSAPPEIRKLASTLGENQKIALFITHAMKIESSDAKGSALWQKVMIRIKMLFARAYITGIFDCLGELDDKAANDLAASGIPMLEQFAVLRPQTIGHPDTTDLKAAGRFARQIVPPQD
jgi:flavodoxin